MLSTVICGMEHSGTTLVSDLLRQSGKLESGFECGVLMAPSPSEFPSVEPFYGNMAKGWQISAEALASCCETDSFSEFYNRLKHASPLIPDSCEVFDKTPRYITRLDDILNKVSARVVLIHKDPRASVYSDYKRDGPEHFETWLRDYIPRKLPYMRRCYEGYQVALGHPDRVCVMSLEDLCFASRATCERLYTHLGLAFDIEDLLLDNLRYKNTRKEYVSAPIVLSYRRHFEKDQQALITDALSEFGDWFYD